MADLTEQQLLATDPEVMGLQYKRQLANLLTGQAFNQPQGQMISGHYVKPSALQQALPMINAAIGGFTSANLDTEQQRIAQLLKQKQVLEAQNIMSAGSPEDKIQAALGGTTNLSRGLATKLLENYTNPIYEKTEINVDGKVVKGVYDKRNSNVMATFKPYNESTDVPLATAQYSGIVPKTITQNNSNFVNEAQGAGLPIISGVRTPLEQAELRHHKDPITGQWMTKEGRPVAENSAHLSGNAIDLNPKVPLTPQQQTWLNQNATQPNPTKDANHWELNPGASGKMPQAKSFGKSKYDLEVPKQFNTPKERDEWFAKSREPLPSESLKIVNGAENTIKTLRDYNAAVQTFKKEDMLSPDKSAAMLGLTKNAILSLKDAKGLGVLNVHDLPQLEAILRDPSDLKNILNSKELFQKLANNQIDYAGSVIAKNYKNSYKQMPEETKSMLLQIDSEKEQQTKTPLLSLNKPVLYNSEAAAQAAGKSGTLKDGQKVVIGGKLYTWKND
jgi:hypothetical protein